MANEKRLIDANEALEALCNYCGVEGCCPEGGCAEFQKISKLPTVDAVEVVRCKNCTHWKHRFEFIGDCSCPRYHLFGHADPSTGANDFCSCGERRTE